MYEALREMLQKSRRIVFLGGAGVSTESGIPDFRSENGLWHAKTKYGCSPEELVSHSFFEQRTEEFYDFFLRCMVFPAVKPNVTHRALAQLEAEGRLLAIVTQNIDGLHQAAGSQKVLELHGSVWRYFCMDCGAAYDLPYVLEAAKARRDSCVPRCAKCGGIVKPDVVLFEEPLDAQILSEAVEAIRQADLLLVGGTSLVVYPAAGLLHYFKGENLVLINKQPTPFDKQARLVINDALGKVFGAVVPAADA